MTVFGQIGKTGVLVLQNVELGCEKEQDQSNKKICIMENLVKISKLKPRSLSKNLTEILAWKQTLVCIYSRASNKCAGCNHCVGWKNSQNQ